MTGFTIEVDGRSVQARTGDTVAVVLLRAGIVPAGECSGRGLFCGMGSCFECHAVVDGIPFVRTCMTSARAGMHVKTRFAEEQL
jgi:predicted molibdopterin-dependent oxidoreductase YjgC